MRQLDKESTAQCASHLMKADNDNDNGSDIR